MNAVDCSKKTLEVCDILFYNENMMQIVPDAPGSLSFQCHVSVEQIMRHIQVAEENERGVLRLVDKRVPYTVYKGIVNFRWSTPLSNGSMIEKYEIRYRVHVPGDKSMVCYVYIYKYI